MKFKLIAMICISLWIVSHHAAHGDAKTVDVGQWKRFEVAYNNAAFVGNPFDVEFYGVFKHTSSNRTLKQLGFYAGGNTWKLYFMPDRTGEWTFKTVSPDPDLHGKTGSFQCVESNLPGRLLPIGRRWKLEERGYDLPIMIPTRQWFKRTETAAGVSDFIQWAQRTVGARIIGTTLVYFTHAQDEKPYVEGKEGEAFNIPMWDRLNSHYDMLRDAGMGHYMMFYSDDENAPDLKGIEAKSEKELRLFRYAVARFAAYPIVIWDTGIDIGETRSDDWIDWFADWFKAHDPWHHPIGSRSGGGSGGKHPRNGTYWSDGAARLPSREALVSKWWRQNVPLAFTDRWREGARRGSFDRDDIRRAVWESGLLGGSAVYVSGNKHDGYLGPDYSSDFKAASDCGHAARFFRYQVSDLGKLIPHDELVKTGTAVLSANLNKEYVAYLPDGGTTTIDLRDASGMFGIRWYDPRRGTTQSHAKIRGGRLHTFTAPDSKDWVLWIVKATTSS